MSAGSGEHAPGRVPAGAQTPVGPTYAGRTAGLLHLARAWVGGVLRCHGGAGRTERPAPRPLSGQGLPTVGACRRWAAEASSSRALPEPSTTPASAAG